VVGFSVEFGDMEPHVQSGCCGFLCAEELIILLLVCFSTEVAGFHYDGCI